MVSVRSIFKNKRHRRLILAGLCMLAGLVLLGFAASGIWRRYAATHRPATLPEAGNVVSEDKTTPEETVPSNVADYRVPADQPRSIDLPSIGAGGLIQKIGLDKKGAVVAPTNVNFAGWYAPEARPGEKGVSLIDGHVQGRYNPGIFKNLSRLKAGDRFSVEFGDHSRRQFEVVSVVSYPVAEAGKRMLQQDGSIGRQLNLITCGGVYDRDSGQYPDRVLVVSRAL